MKTLIHIDTHPSNALTCFKSLTEALSSSIAKKAAELEIHLHTGRFKGNIKVERPLSIIGEGNNRNDIMLEARIENNHGHPLLLKNLTIRVSRNESILQSGGFLNIKNVIIKGYQAEKNKLLTKSPGPCIKLINGAKARIDELTTVFLNNFIVLYLKGEETKVVVSDLTVEDNLMSPSLVNGQTPEYGVIDISDFATLLIENSLIRNNEYLSIFVHDGGKMHLRNTIVTGTKALNSPDGLKGGYNIAVFSGAIVELRDFVTSSAQSAGIYIDQAFVTARDGAVNDNAIGLVLKNPPQEPGYDAFTCCSNGVSFNNNGQKICSVSIPVPDPLATPDYSKCRIVPWN